MGSCHSTQRVATSSVRVQGRNGVSWMNDSEAPRCGDCQEMFTLLKRRHHCRKCGRIFCRQCLPNREQLAGYTAPQKVCKFCANPASSSQQRSSRPPVYYTATPSGRQSNPQREMLREAFATGVCPYCRRDVGVSLIEGHTQVCRTQQQPTPATEESEATTANPLKLCPKCNMMIHVVVYDGHRECCNLNKKPTDEPSGDDKDSVSSIAEDELCVICLDARRGTAFVPCGHWSCCLSCSPKITTCPMCRSEVTSRIEVEPYTKVDICTICHLHIHPTFFDSHREVCRLQLKQRRSAAQQLDEASGGESGVAKCSLCSEQPCEVAFIPCGHYCSCSACSADRSTCPICCVEIRSVLPIYQ